MTHKDRDVSPVANEPALHLAAAVCKQALFDYLSSDVVTALDSFCWWLDEAGAPFLMDAIGYPSDRDLILWRLTRAKNTRTTCQE